MTLYEFELKFDHEQYNLVFTQGDFILYHIEDSRRIGAINRLEKEALLKEIF
ncbi:hypothetical protein OQ279_09455 [Salinimicrobium sp. MT39]|uniref:Uncharacterized protein n=1 Tax=Salinimicrobium profundisediminis TaxID=2994553 RepID=A0A9X3CX68_9FLAO|nr:hypothetical protein [Salinimicrobium profundisediminis]MCX2838378.1 hypothetical protein [Salinimicrobium profundisediminis]